MISPPSNHPVTKRNDAVVDLSIDTVLIVDKQGGGGVVGHVVLHDWSDDDNGDKLLNPLSVATYDSCKHIFMTCKNMLYIINLDRPLNNMMATFCCCCWHHWPLCLDRSGRRVACKALE